MEQLYKKYGPALVRKAIRLLRNEEDAQDIVQQLFTDLWSKKNINVDLPYLYVMLHESDFNRKFPFNINFTFSLQL